MSQSLLARDESSRTQTPDRLDVGARPRSSIAGVFVPAFVLFVVLLAVAPAPQPPPSRGRLPVHPDVMIAGSSVIETPLNLYEHPKTSEYFNELHPYCRTVKTERLLEKQGVIEPSIWTGAMSGERIERTAEFIDRNLVGERTPRELVLFIAPVVLVANRQRKILSLESFEDWAKQHRVRVPSLIAMRASMQKDTINSVCSVYRKLHWNESLPQRMIRSQTRYTGHYKGRLGGDSLDNLNYIIEICERRGIRLLVVSTPLAAPNRSLLNRWSYADYIAMITAATRNHCRFLDLGTAPEFSWPKDYYDAAHCNQFGGKKMMQLVAPQMAALLKEPLHQPR